MKHLLALLLTLLALPASALANPAFVRTDNAEVELVSNLSQLSASTKALSLGFKFKLRPQWHIYWQNAGDSGIPPKLQMEAIKGVSFSDFDWPPPKRLELGPLANYGYEGEVILPLTARLEEPASASMVFSAKLDWLICKEDCIPESGEFLLEIPFGKNAESSKEQSEFTKNRSLYSSASFSRSDIRLEEGKLRINLSSEAPVFDSLASAYFFPESESLVAASAEQSFFFDSNSLQLNAQTGESFSKLSPVERGILKLGFASGEEKHYRVELSSEELGDSSSESPEKAMKPTEAGSFKLPIGIALALLGGLLLNLMPCVFPVISLKVMSFTKKAHDDPALIRAHGISFFFGVLISMLLLAGLLLVLKSGGEAIGWGFHLQSPVFVSFMTLLFFVLSLSFLGYFELDFPAASGWAAAFKSDSLTTSFMNGVLATVIATPCTGPFMAQALGFAITLEPAEMLLIFAALGTGMGSPYLMFAFFPATLRWLPKPGDWMEVFRQLLAFPLLIFTVFMLWVLSAQAGSKGILLTLSSCLIAFTAIWVAKTFRGAVFKAVSLLLIAGSFYAAASVTAEPVSSSAPAAPGEVQWMEFRPGLAEELAASGSLVYSDFTAAWCITCQVNKKVVFSSSEVLNFVKENDVKLIRADWTNQDESISKELEKFERAGVPLNVIYKQGKTPKVLPSLLTPSVVLDALREAQS